MALANQLMYSEQKDWLDALRKLDLAQSSRTSMRYTHWFMQKAGPMQRGQNTLYSSQKQSIWKCWKVEPGNPHWVDWESTSKYDTNCDKQVAHMPEKLQEHVTELQALRDEQLSGEEIAQVVSKVVAPVVTMTPIPEGMDTDAVGARPEPTMGPGQLSPSPDMPLVFDDDD